MIKVVAKYIASAAVVAAWLYVAYWAAASSYPAVNVVAGITAISIAFTALLVTMATADSPGTRVNTDEDRFDMGTWSIAFLTNFVFWSKIAYASMWDWFTGPGVLVFVSGIVSGVYAMWPELEKDFSAVKRAREAKIFHFNRHR